MFDRYIGCFVRIVVIVIFLGYSMGIFFMFTMITIVAMIAIVVR